MNIPVMVCTDGNYLACTSVMILSICETASPDNIYDIYVLMKDVDRDAEEKYSEMTAAYPNVNIRFVSVSDYTRGYGFYNETRPEITEAAYYRLYIPYLFPELDKAVYLDGDLIVKKDIAQLYNIPLEELIGAVRDYPGIGVYISETTDRKEFYTNYLDFFDYFNSGVLLMNLALFRERFSVHEIKSMPQSKKWRNHDQDILNVLALNSKKLLPPNWNIPEERRYYKYLPKELEDSIFEAEKDPYIIHFSGLQCKPWRRMGLHAIHDFWPLAEKSPWFIELAAECLEFAPRYIGYVQLFLNDAIREGKSKELFTLNNQKFLALELIKHLLTVTGKAFGDSDEAIAQRIALISRTKGNPISIKNCIPKRRLSFELDIADHCNLNCKYCAHFATVSEKHYADLEETKRAFRRLSELFGGEVNFIHLLGGEPLLNPQVTDFAIAAREAFPIGNIEIVTNGILLMTMPERFWEVCRDYGIQVSISNYPIKLPIDDIMARASGFGVNCTYFNSSDKEITSFIKYTMDASGGFDPDDSFRKCYLVASCCVTLRSGRLYPCSTAGCINRFNNHFGDIIHESPEDSIDVFEAKSAREILNFLSSPIPMCRYCDVKNRTQDNMWSCGDAGDITEWLKD